MAKSQRLRLGQVRSAFRLVGEVAECADGWRAHWLQGLVELTGSHVVMGGDAIVTGGGGIAIPGAIDMGWATESDRRVYLEFMTDGRCLQEPTTPVIVADPGAAWTRARRHLIDDGAYYRSEGYLARREGHNGDYLHSCRPWPEEGVICMLQLNRSLGARVFEPVELKLVQLCQAELARDRVALRRRERERLVGLLAPRPRQVLELLLAGKSEKMIAAGMGISEHTVHQYVKGIYSRFGVHGRGELLARWVRR